MGRMGAYAAPMSRRPKACCEMMAAQLHLTCEDHPSLEDCPDSIIGFFASTGDYGLRIHDGGSSLLIIDFCPWCRTSLRPLKRGALVRSKRLTREALPDGLAPRTRKLPGGAMPGRRIEP